MGFLVSHVSGNEVVHDFVTLAGADDPRGRDAMPKVRHIFYRHMSMTPRRARSL